MDLSWKRKFGGRGWQLANVVGRVLGRVGGALLLHRSWHLRSGARFETLRSETGWRGANFDGTTQDAGK